MPATDDPTAPWRKFRSQMPVTEHWAYFDHAAVAPLSEPARAAVVEWAEDVARHGDTNWPGWSRRVEGTRAAAAELIGAQREEVALVPNTTAGVNLVAEAFPWREGDNVVIFQGEFPTNRLAWQELARRGVEVREVPTDRERVNLDDVEAACDGRTGVVAVSWVGFATGWRNDLDALAEIAQRHGACLFVDAIQALGVQPLDVRRTPIDFLAADGHKWLLAPEGAGVFYLRAEHLDRLRNVGLGWNSAEYGGDYSKADAKIKDTAARYEGGSYNVAGLAALGASLRMFLDYGVENVARRLDEVSETICEQLAAAGATIASSREPTERSGIVAFEWPGVAPASARRRCQSEGVVLNCRAGRLRVSPHAYTDETDVDRLLAALESAAE